jgi:hypothetical protein
VVNKNPFFKRIPNLLEFHPEILELLNIISGICAVSDIKTGKLAYPFSSLFLKWSLKSGFKVKPELVCDSIFRRVNMLFRLGTD